MRTGFASKWLFGAVAVLLVAFLVIAGEGPQIERDLTQRANAVLKEHGYSWATVTFSGRDGIMTGTAFDVSERDAARKVVGAVHGVATMQDRAQLLPGASPYTWWASRNDKQVRIKGHAPSAADQQTIVGIVKATLPGLEIDDRTKLASGVPARENWLAAVSFALNQLSHIDEGGVWLSGMTLRVSGRAINQASYAALTKALSGAMPAGLKPERREITPPKAKPYSVTIEYSGHTVKLSGHVPNDMMRKALVDKVNADFADVEIEDAMVFASGAPKDWGNAVDAAVALLSRLEEGTVTIRNKDLAVQGSVANQATAEEVSRLISETIPAPYKPAEKIKVHESPPAKPDRRGAGKRHESETGQPSRSAAIQDASEIRTALFFH